jgi:LmbE family N-acetylglucosaminyl deacetylase
MVMFAMRKKSRFRLKRLVRNRLLTTLCVLLAAATAFFAAGQTPEHPATDHNPDRPADHPADHAVDHPAVHPADHYYDPLPQDIGATGLKLMLRRLQTTGRLMQVDAHPDDEDGGMLTLEARGKGVSTLLMTLNRGEGGQNKLGSNLFDVLGVVRTLEVLAADRYYGVEQRFSRVADFGYSKTPEETFQKWQGHDIALADIVRVVRTFHPDVLIARFSGTERDGHGHHQASAILTKEAFRAAADPNRFPEQIKEGLQPWQPKKLYIGNVCGFGASTCDAGNYTVKLNTGKEDPLLGESYVQFAIEGLRHQQSQALGGVSVPKGDRFAYYKLVDSVVDSPKDKDGHEQDFFDGIDTTLPGLASRLGDEEKKVPWLRGRLSEISAKIDDAVAAKDHSEALDAALAAAATLTAQSFNDVMGSQLAGPDKAYLRLQLLQKLLGELMDARAIAAGAKLSAIVDAPIGENPEAAFMAVQGESFELTARLSVATSVNENAVVSLKLPQGWKFEELKRSRSGNELRVHFRVHVPQDAEITRPYWHRHDPERDALNTIDQPEYQTLPFPPFPVEAVANYAKGQLVKAVCMVRYKDASGNLAERPVAVAPAYSVGLSPSSAVFPTDLHGGSSVRSSIREQGNGSEAQIALRVPDGWHAEPPRETLKIAKDRSKDVMFRVEPADLKEERTHIFAELTSGNRKYDEGYTVVTREDLGTFYYYQPAIQSVSIVDVKVPKDLKLAYIMGAGDDIPTVLEQLGMNVNMIPADKLASEDLSKYQTIVLGIRAYDTQKGVIDNNKRLLDFVANGGRLVVQYNTLGSFGVPIDFNSGKYTPYPATLGRARVSVEEAPIVILDPANPIFHSPNEIAEKDFDGWVQERGLYFMTQWDSNFTPLLESHDPGEPEQKGGLLVAHYGKGTYIYTGYAFFRQLPAGVPGAVRLFVNLISSR